MIMMITRKNVQYRTEYTTKSPDIGLYRLVLEYCSWYTDNIVNISVSNALFIGIGPLAAVLLCTKWDIIFRHCYPPHTTPAPFSNINKLNIGMQIYGSVLTRMDFLNARYLLPRSSRCGITDSPSLLPPSDYPFSSLSIYSHQRHSLYNFLLILILVSVSTAAQ